jgi:hypothetical protein
MIRKVNGEYEPFDPEKLRRSLREAGTDPQTCSHIVDTIIGELKDGMETKKIYRRAFGILRTKRKKPNAIRYSLRRAIAELGPSGYPFERFFGEILRRKGYEVQVGIDVKGWCAPHEIDVSAHKGGTHYLVECKFHNNHGIRSDIKTALYVQARFEDLEKKYLQDKVDSERFHEAWLVTNTKFTSAAIQYGKCVGMHMIGWGYPKHAGLRELVEETGIYPITVLPGLSQAHKQALLGRDIITCCQLVQARTALIDLGLSKKRIAQVYNEIPMICPHARNLKE